MPNPSGSNQFQKEYRYGEKARMRALEREAPMSGAPIATNAPQRAQRKAVRGASAGAAPAPAVAAPPPPTETPYRTQISVIYQELAREAPDDPLIQYYAQVAAQQASA